jgi:glycosyltransferase involved in cell wall biosynthesis
MSEGFGLTLLEANASGRPVIASNVGGIPSVVKNGYNGLLVHPNDPVALANAIARLEGNRPEARAMGCNGRRFAEMRDWSNTASQTERVYAEVLSSDS